jgi:hypothetical protein
VDVEKVPWLEDTSAPGVLCQRLDVMYTAEGYPSMGVQQMPALPGLL